MVQPETKQLHFGFTHPGGVAFAIMPSTKRRYQPT
jgi:hypothetical protein